tara:strand:+ start:610 stop:774 length:165 start_codon:yes stop_codon:yes gene_type:complete
MKLCGKTIKLIAYDFDEVMTDNKALIFFNGDEAVFINRGDGVIRDIYRKISLGN